LATDVAIQLRNISKRFDPIQSLSHLSMQVRCGEIFGLLGPNGAGKTTTVRTILGLVRPDDGEASVFGLNPFTHAREVRQQIGVLLENDGLYDRLSAWDNLDFHGRIWHLPSRVRQERMESLLGPLGLWERRNDQVATWSKGVRQKLAIARALLPKPRALLLDEPFSGLDPIAAVEIREKISSLALGHGVTVFLTSHDLFQVEKLCTRIAIMRSGEIIADGSPSNLQRDFMEIIELRVLGVGITPELMAALQQQGLVGSFSMGPNSATVICKPEMRQRIIAELVRNGVAIEELVRVKRSLEDSFLSVIKGACDER
jgi:ABC-2 type transport system ATP-binding protein